MADVTELTATGVREISVADFRTGAENPFEDDGRTWWFLSANLWSGIHSYVAPNARRALADYRADIAEAETMNGRSGRETKAYLKAAGFHVVWGPFGTRQAFEIELGMALANEIADSMRGSGQYVAFSPATLAECPPLVDQHTLSTSSTGTWWRRSPGGQRDRDRCPAPPHR